MTCDIEGVAAEDIDKGDLVYLDKHYVRCMNSFYQLDNVTKFEAITSARAGHNVTVRPSWLGIS